MKALSIAALLVLFAPAGGCQTDKVGLYIDGPLEEIDGDLKAFRGTPDRAPAPNRGAGRWGAGR